MLISFKISGFSPMRQCTDATAAKVMHHILQKQICKPSKPVNNHLTFLDRLYAQFRSCQADHSTSYNGEYNATECRNKSYQADIFAAGDGKSHWGVESDGGAFLWVPRLAGYKQRGDGFPAGDETAVRPIRGGAAGNTRFSTVEGDSWKCTERADKPDARSVASGTVLCSTN